VSLKITYISRLQYVVRVQRRAEIKRGYLKKSIITNSVSIYFCFLLPSVLTVDASYTEWYIDGRSKKCPSYYTTAWLKTLAGLNAGSQRSPYNLLVTWYCTLRFYLDSLI